MNHDPSPPPAGLYLHVPFCRAKCPYCDFYSLTATRHIPPFVEALLTEIDRQPRTVSVADTIYFGGGTPSLLTPSQVVRILDRLRTRFPVASDAEVTLEVNPGTVDRQRLVDYRSAGVNRLNIGLQSLKEATLRSLGRIHSADQGLATYRWAEAAGFDNLGIDLIYGLPGQTLGGWRSELRAAVDLAPRHLSCYTLTVEPGTPLATRVDAGDCRRPDEKRVGDLFTFTIDDLARRGYQQYEISNFARRAADPTIDWRSRHNRKYWNGAPYLGFGPSAHSFRNRRRWWNHRDLERYLAACRSGRLPTAGEETLTREQRLMESIYLGLRQTDGIDADAIGNRFGTDLIEKLKPELARLTREGLVGDDASRIRLTVRGMLFLEQVAGRLLERV